MPHSCRFVASLVLLLCSVGFPAVAQEEIPSAFNTIVLNAPPVPQPPPPTKFGISLQSNAASVSGLSIPHPGSFYGFSIEMSVANQIVGINPRVIQVPFLNLLSIITQRAGQVNIRIGGNTQDYATVIDYINGPGGETISKNNGDTSNPTDTPPLFIDPDFIGTFANVSSLVNAKWYLGIPMNDTANPRLRIAEVGEAYLGDNLLGFQVGNEPDLYLNHKHRQAPYGPPEYFKEFGAMVDAIKNDPMIKTRGNLIGPSLSNTQTKDGWTNNAIWNTGYIDAYGPALGALAAERYPDNNCFEKGNGAGHPKDSQTVFANYLSHTISVNTVSDYLVDTALAQQVGKPFIMFETNSASCGGFDGVSDSFGAALWALDYGLQMAYGNFSGALLHVGGMDVSYNPFTPPVTAESIYRKWTVGPVFYSVVAVAEALGRSGQAQVIDLHTNDNNVYTPGYAIYDKGVLAKVALFNFVSDPSGASKYTATISVAGAGVPASVSVKYLLADSVSNKFNVTWAGQTLGGQYEADGRWIGEETIQTVACDQAAGTCSIDVPAPGFALVFLDSNALADSEPTSTQTFPSTTCTAGAARCRSMGYTPPSMQTASPGLPGFSKSSSSVPVPTSSKHPVTGNTSDSGASTLKVSGMGAVLALVCATVVATLF